TGTVFGEERTWHVDFAAEMPHFSVGRVPQLNEYQLGLNVTWEENNRTFDGDDIDQACDLAALWAIAASRDQNAVRALLEPFRDKKGVQWSAHLRANDEAVRGIVAAL